jgi:membrane associated rhomboid family serine protease
MPRATQAIIGLNVVVFLLQQQAGLRDQLIITFALWPLDTSAIAAAFGPGISFAPWQLVTYGFLHGGFTHIFFNMFAVYMFGSALEQFFGTRYYVTLFLVSVVAAGLTQLVFNAVLGSPVPTLGASGGVYGLLLAFAIYFPQQRLALIFLPVPIPARIFVAGYALIELFLGVTGTQAGVAHFAHLGGMLGAFLLIQWRRGKPPFFPRRRR